MPRCIRRGASNDAGGTGWKMRVRVPAVAPDNQAGQHGLACLTINAM